MNVARFGVTQTSTCQKKPMSSCCPIGPEIGNKIHSCRTGTMRGWKVVLHNFPLCVTLSLNYSGRTVPATSQKQEYQHRGWRHLRSSAPGKSANHLGIQEKWNFLAALQTQGSEFLVCSFNVTQRCTEDPFLLTFWSAFLAEIKTNLLQRAHKRNGPSFPLCLSPAHETINATQAVKVWKRASVVENVLIVLIPVVPDQ